MMLTNAEMVVMCKVFRLPWYIKYGREMLTKIALPRYTRVDTECVDQNSLVTMIIRISQKLKNNSLSFSLSVDAHFDAKMIYALRLLVTLV